MRKAPERPQYENIQLLGLCMRLMRSRVSEISALWRRACDTGGLTGGYSNELQASNALLRPRFVLMHITHCLTLMDG